MDGVRCILSVAIFMRMPISNARSQMVQSWRRLQLQVAKPRRSRIQVKFTCFFFSFRLFLLCTVFFLHWNLNRSSETTNVRKKTGNKINKIKLHYSTKQKQKCSDIGAEFASATGTMHEQSCAVYVIQIRASAHNFAFFSFAIFVI